MIVAAAIRYGFLVMSMPQPARHHDCLHQLYHMLEDAKDGDSSGITAIQSECLQGFITHTGEFLERKMALIHARNCGQGTPRRDQRLKNDPNGYSGDELYSEDIW